MNPKLRIVGGSNFQLAVEPTLDSSLSEDIKQMRRLYLQLQELDDMRLEIENKLTNLSEKIFGAASIVED